MKNLGFGCMRLPMAGGEVDLAQFEQMVDRFLAAGCTYFDTAHGYLDGKSETAIELVKRGHRLIADDAVEIKKVSPHELVGSAPPVLKHYIELRGIGVINVAKLFGMGAVKESSNIDLIINMVPWRDGEAYDRLGMETQYTEILDVKVPSITVPITPGRNLAVIFEVAAMNNRQKRMGYNAAVEFTEQMSRFFETRET